MYCDENRLSTKERLGLFITVCRAVPKVIDFGIAKATNQRLTEKRYGRNRLSVAVDPYIGRDAGWRDGEKEEAD